MAEKTVSKRNSAIEFWRFVIAISIVGFHIGFIIANSCNGSNGYYLESSNWFFGSSEVLWIFTITAGYFMVSHFKKRESIKEYAEKSASSRAWEYTWARIKALLPVLIIGYVLGVLICTKFYYPDYNFQQIMTMTINSIWEFLGFHAAGLRSSGNEFFNLNGPLWFISAIIIVGYFMYWLLCKNEELLAGIIAPFTLIFLGGWWCFTGTRASQTAWSTIGLQTASTNGTGGSATASTAILGFNNGLLFVLMGMLAGVILYYAIQKFKDHKFTTGGKLALSILYLVCGGLLIWYNFYPATWFNLERWTVAFLCMVVIGLTLLNKDKITGILNNKYTNGLLNYLGGISLHIYMLHYPIAILILRVLGPNTKATTYSFWQIYIPAILLTIVLSMFLKAVMDIIQADIRDVKEEKDKVEKQS